MNDKVFSIDSRLELDEEFLNEYKDKQPNFGPLGYVTYKRTYSRMKSDGKPEEFVDTLKRVVEGTYSIQKTHCKKMRLPWNEKKAQESAQEMFRRMWDFKFLPPGRGMWMMGAEFVEQKGGAALNNCGFVTTKNIDKDFSGPFIWLMDMSCLGVGIGFDTRGAGKLCLSAPEPSDEEYVVEDSREGWCKLVKMVLDSYVGKSKLHSNINYSKIRSAGERIKGFGGVASGPGPLKLLVEELSNELNKFINKEVTSELITDIGNLIGKCVVSGNVRRSAEIVFGNYKDEKFLELKNPDINKEKLYNHRWASNNSIFAEVGMDYSKVAEMTAKNGEPGYQWLDNARAYSRMKDSPDHADEEAEGSNPCNEQTLFSYELCCLVETFPSRHDSLEDWQETLKYAYLYAKTVTLVPTHSEETNSVLLKNRRIGTSISGIIQAMNKFGKRNFLTSASGGYDKLKKLDKKYSKWLCVPTSIKISSVKPSGSISLLAGTTPGIHFPHSEYYIRRIRFQKGSELLEQLRDAGYKVEDDKYSLNTSVVEFPIKEEYYSRGKDDVSMWEQLEIAAQIQYYWADNQVSVTVTFTKEEAKDIKNALELYETRLKGVSFLPISEHGYEQAPYEKITKEQFEQMNHSIKQVSIKNNIHDKEEKFCDGDYCVV
jgi:adenosylcobalamin-dependent ribonucleoside-triphosphate reductase